MRILGHCRTPLSRFVVDLLWTWCEFVELLRVCCGLVDVSYFQHKCCGFVLGDFSSICWWTCFGFVVDTKKVKIAHIRLPSVGFRSWSRFLAVSLQVTWVINPAVGCHYFPPGLQLPPQPLKGLLPISLLGEQRHNGCEQLLRLLLDSFATATWTQALLRPSPAR